MTAWCQRTGGLLSAKPSNLCCRTCRADVLIPLQHIQCVASSAVLGYRLLDSVPILFNTCSAAFPGSGGACPRNNKFTSLAGPCGLPSVLCCSTYPQFSLTIVLCIGQVREGKGESNPTDKSPIKEENNQLLKGVDLCCHKSYLASAYDLLKLKNLFPSYKLATFQAATKCVTANHASLSFSKTCLFLLEWHIYREKKHEGSPLCWLPRWLLRPELSLSEVNVRSNF